MIGYGLFNAAGNRENAAPLVVVQDNLSPIDAEINAGGDCQRCHKNGIIPMDDQIRDHVLSAGSGFDAIDRETVRELYRGKGALLAAITRDNRIFQAALDKLGIFADDPDPVNLALDRFKLDLDLKEVASFLFLEENELSELLPQSQIASQKIGQLLSGGTVSLEVLKATLPDLIRDLRLFEDPLGEQ